MLMVEIDLSREEFVKENLGLVHSICRRFAGRGIEYEDLYQAGCLGLVKAVDAFDEKRGFAFSTYAVPVIMGEVRRLFRDGGAVKVSRSVKELYLKIVKTFNLSLSLAQFQKCHIIYSQVALA
jgi:RNA polymerase sporulation-specific sigma factor